MQVQVSEFKANCSKLINLVAETGEEIIITKYGSSIAKMIPYVKKPRDICGTYEGKIHILGDIVSPLENDWEAR